VTLILAHGLGGRADLPVPLWLAVYGGAAAVLVSFAALGVFWREPKLKGAEAGRPLPGAVQRAVDGSSTRVLVRLGGVLLVTITLAVAALGRDNSIDNPAPTWFYVWFWVGLAPASLLLGPVWRALNPLRALSELLARLSGDPGQSYARSAPERLGYWPAAAGLFAFVWVELVFDRPDEPLTVVMFIALYGLLQLVAAQTYGVAWYSEGDGFEVYSTLISKLCPVGRRSDGRLVFRNPLDGLLTLETAPGLLAVICVLLGSTAFDGLSRTQWWQQLSQSRAGTANLLLGTAGLTGAIAFVAATYTASMKLSRRFARDSTRDLEATFATSLMPIVIGYATAHYFSLLVFQGQAGYILASDPLARGWNLFGTADWRIAYTVMSTGAIALAQVASIVIGHVVAVVAAHDRAMTIFSGRNKTRGQYALLAVMIVYTVGGIALLVGT
jgi:hypothetical protein